MIRKLLVVLLAACVSVCAEDLCMDIGFEVVECNLIQSGAFPLEDKACYELPDTAYMSMDAAQPSEIYLVSDFTIQVACETPLPSPGASPADVSIGSTAATDPVDFSSNARAAYEAYMSTYLADSETASLLDEAAFASSARAAYESYTATYVAATTAAGARDETALSSSVRAAYENYTSSYTNAETGTGTAGIEAVATDSVAPTTSSDAGTDESTATTTVAARETESVTASVGGARREASGVNARARRQEPTVVSLMGKCVVLDHTQLPFECPKRSETIVVDWEIENYVVIGGYKYASIQDDPVDERNATDWDCTVADGAIMPDGWEIAPLDWRSQIAMQMRGFGGEHVILANYKAFSTLTKFEDILPFDGAIEHYDDETRRYQPVSCGMKVLITQKDTLASTDRNLLRAEKVLSSYINFNNTLYATIDNHPATDTEQGCQSQGAMMPDGWELAKDDSQARVALLGAKHKFGTLCYTVEGGGSFMTGGEDCGNNTLMSAEADGETYYWPSSCARRVLIQRTSTDNTASPTWDYAPPITNAAIQAGMQYASIDNASPYGQDVGCSDGSYELPTGWSLADWEDARTTQVLKDNSWGVWCVIMADGKGLTTGPDPVECAKDGLNTFERQGVRKYWITVPTKCADVANILNCALQWVADDLNAPPEERALETPTIEYHRGSEPTNTGLKPDMVWAVQWENYTQTFHSVKYCDQRVLIQKPISDIRVLSQNTQRALLLYADATAFHKGFAEELFDRHDMKFDAINTVETDTLLLTNDQDGSPKYYAIFLTDATLSIEEESGDWQSSLSNEQWKGIDTYQARYGVRSVSLSSYPSAALGMKVSPVPGLNDNVYLHPVSGGPLHMEPMPLARENIYIVPAQVDLGDDQTFNVTTAMVFTNTADPPANDPDHIAAALIISVSGAERMHFFLSTSYGVPHGETLANSMVAWSTEYVEPADKGPNTTLFIALGVVGGLILLVALGYCCMRCCRRWSEGIADTSIKAYDNESWEAANRH